MLATRAGQAIGVWTLGRAGVIWRYPRYLRELEPACNELNRLRECAKVTTSGVPAQPPVEERGVASA